MGDRALLEIHVYRCPPGQRETAVKALTEWYVEPEADEYPEPGEVLSLTCPEYPREDLGNLVAALRQAAPGCSYYLWLCQDMIMLGEVHAYTPEFGSFTADSNDRDAVFTVDEINGFAWDATRRGLRRFLPFRLLPMRQRTLMNRLNRAMGAPWIEDWQTHQAARSDQRPAI